MKHRAENSPWRNVGNGFRVQCAKASYQTLDRIAQHSRWRIVDSQGPRYAIAHWHAYLTPHAEKLVYISG